MHKCPKCNEEVRPNESFCHNCGERLIEVTYDKQKQSKGGRILFLIMASLLIAGFTILVSMDFYYLFNTTSGINALDITSICIHALCLLIPLVAFILRLSKPKLDYVYTQSLVLLTILIDYLYHALFLTINYKNINQIILSFMGFAITGVCLVITAIFKKKVQLSNLTFKIYAFVICLLTIMQSDDFLDVYYLADVYWLGRNFIDIGTVMLLFYTAFGIQVIKRIRSKAIYVEDQPQQFFTLNDGNVIDNEKPIIPLTRNQSTTYRLWHQHRQILHDTAYEFPVLLEA